MTLTPCQMTWTPDDWFPAAHARTPRGQPNPRYRQQAAKAKKACADCPIVEFTRCRDIGLHETVEGIWGGMDQLDREQERRRLRIIPADHRPNNRLGRTA